MNITMSKRFQAGDGNIIRAQFPAGRPGAFSVFSRVARAWGALRAWNNRRIARRELSAMPDVLLRDIGIERYQIRDAVNGAYPDIVRLRGANRVPAPAVIAEAEVKKAA